MRCEQTHHKRTAEKCSRAKVKHMSLNGRLRCYLIARGQAYISRTCHIAPKIQSVTTYSNTRTFLALPVNTMAKKEDTQRPKRCTRMGVYARSESFTPNDRTFGGRVAEESRLVIAGALPTAFISSSHPPNNEYISTLLLPTKTNNTMHLSATLRADPTSGALRQRESNIRTADRLEPSGCCVSQEQGTTDHT